ncbi:MAG TPA: TrbG/VirB9 family P-type conjugative transfer protein [Steroidobacteraceae bacterium]|nr:TrbG/VirB9 family P-type conjugative transfer protein [Steroidobacteraceae bacterium]
MTPDRAVALGGESTAALTGLDDPRVRDVSYAPNAVYHLSGRIGYQIDIEFEAGERYVGLAAGDVNGLSFEAQDNHVFLKPKATNVTTNLTILTDRRHYYFDYTVNSTRATVTAASDTLYALRFRYPQEAARQVASHESVTQLNQALDIGVQPLNRQYGFCGSRFLQPTAAFDDGVRTHLAFPGHAEFPAVYVQNDDGTESLVNFTVTPDGLTIHRIARRLILRRGALRGCVVNEAYDGSGERLTTGTVSTDVRRDSPPANP